MLELGLRGVAGLGPDTLAQPADVDAMIRALRRLDSSSEIGTALLQQRAVAGIGNVWRSEALLLAKVSPWQKLEDVSDELLGHVLRTAAEAMLSGSKRRWAYRRAGASLPAVRLVDCRETPGRRRSHGLLVPSLSGRNRRRNRVSIGVQRSRPSVPRLRDALRLFCLGCFYELTSELEDGADVRVELAEHAVRGAAALYEYQPQLDEFIEERADALARREDAVAALAAIKEEPASGIFARARCGRQYGEDEALRRTILIPLLSDTARRCNGFDWDDAAFEEAYLELERVLRGEPRTYRALSPLIGLTARGPFELGAGARVRHASSAEIDEIRQDPIDVPRAFGAEVDRSLVLELELEVGPRDPVVPDGPALISRAVTALRLAMPGAIASGPMVFEYLNGFDYARRAAVELAAQVPTGEATRLDAFRGAVAARVFERLTSGSADIDLLEALERWELALFRQGPVRAEELREGLVSLLGGHEGAWAAAMRAAALVGETPSERTALLRGLVGLVDGEGPGPWAEDVLRRALLETLMADSRDELLAELDRRLLGLHESAEALARASAVASGRLTSHPLAAAEPSSAV